MDVCAKFLAILLRYHVQENGTGGKTSWFWFWQIQLRKLLRDLDDHAVLSIDLSWLQSESG